MEAHILKAPLSLRLDNVVGKSWEIKLAIQMDE